tara:strand:+ start:164 stop:445 length:282 start_codon:yes stop_codon:yes gene_type:complete
MTNRDDVLDDFAIEPELSHAVLKVYLSKYPELSDDLLELFHDLTLSDMEAIVQAPPLPDLVRQLRFLQWLEPDCLLTKLRLLQTKAMTFGDKE